MRFYGVTLALVYPVNPELVSPVNLELSYRSVQSFSTNITSGDCASYRVIKFGSLVNVFVLIDYLSNGTKNVLYGSMSEPSIYFSYRLL